jgi:hypothetical protein
MKLSLLSALSLCAALAACAPMGYHANTRTLGAGPVNGTLCKDGTVLPLNSSCKLHGGVAHH